MARLGKSPQHGLLRRMARAPLRPRHQPRHALATRLWHWLNAAVLLGMVMSGLMIFNAHPRLYWGQYGANPDYAWAEIGASEAGAGFVRVGPYSATTTGWLGVSQGSDGQLAAVAFPGWMTLPGAYDLAQARVWHLGLAWLLAAGLALFLLVSLINGHIARDVHISAREWHPRVLWRDIVDHMRLRFSHSGYGVLQKLAYAGVLFGLLPLMIATGLAMAPGMDAAAPWLVDALGGRQSARSLHFVGLVGLALFVLVHMAMVLASGPLRQIAAMITGGRR